MNIIHGSRRSGKTTKLIKMCAKNNNSIIVAPTRNIAESIFKQSVQLGYNIPKPISFREFSNGQYCRTHINKFYFDELEMCLKAISNNAQIDTIVVSKKQKTNWRYKFIAKIRKALGVHSPSVICKSYWEDGYRSIEY